MFGFVFVFTNSRGDSIASLARFRRVFQLCRQGDCLVGPVPCQPILREPQASCPLLAAVDGFCECGNVKSVRKGFCLLFRERLQKCSNFFFFLAVEGGAQN